MALEALSRSLNEPERRISFETVDRGHLLVLFCVSSPLPSSPIFACLRLHTWVKTFSKVPDSVLNLSSSVVAPKNGYRCAFTDELLSASRLQERDGTERLGLTCKRNRFVSREC